MEKSGAARVYETLGDTDFNLKSSRCSKASLLAHVRFNSSSRLLSDVVNCILDTYSCRYSSGFTPDSLLSLTSKHLRTSQS